MILADQTPALTIVVGITILIGLGIGALYLFRGYEHLARRSLERKYADLAVHPEPQAGDVVLIYHTYHGLVAWFTLTPHHVALPPEDARELLSRLLRFNLTWGLVTYGALFIPPLAILNYFAQRRSIAAQQATGGVPPSINRRADAVVCEFPAAADPEIATSPSAFHRFVGWIAAGLCVIFGISVLVCVVTGEFESAIGGVMVTALLGWLARDWRGNRKIKGA